MLQKENVRTFFRKNWKYIVLALLMYMPLFGHLDSLPLRDHDEGLNSVNAYEMYRNGDLIVVHFNQVPDMYNTKPPLLRWLQMGMMHLIGVNELAVRLPSAFAGFFTCLALLIFCVRVFKNEWLGVITALVLVTTNGYVHSHGTRTADFDALLTLFTTLSCLCFFAYCETLRNRWLYYFFIALACAVLTKGIAGVLFGPALLLYALIQKRVLVLMRNRHFYAGLLIFLILTVGYYLLREWHNPGFIAAVQENELGGRFLENPGNKPDDFWFYYKTLTEFQIADRYLLLPCGLLLGLFSRDSRIRRFTLLTGLLIVCLFLTVSAGQTRLEHYIAPLFPFIAWSIALLVDFIFRWLREWHWTELQPWRNVVPYLFLSIIFIVPYRHIWGKTYLPREVYQWDHEFYEIGNFYQDALRGKIDLTDKYLLYAGWDPHIQFYVYALQEKGVKTNRVRTLEEIKPGYEIVVYQENMKKRLRELFVCEEVVAKGNVYFFRVLRQKSPD